MSLVKIKHPTLDDGRITEVPEESLVHHFAAGWVLADEPAPEPVPAAEPPGEPAGEPEPSKRRGRVSKEVSD